MFGWHRRHFFFIEPAIIPFGAGPGIEPAFRARLPELIWCALLAFFLPFGARLLEIPFWQHPDYILGGEFLLATHDAYHWLAGAQFFEFGAGHPMSEMLRFFSTLTGVDISTVAFWLPPVLGSLVSVFVFLWAWSLGYPYAGVCAGMLVSLSPGFLARTLLGFYDSDLIVLSMVILLGLVPSMWLTPWLASLSDFLRERLSGKRRAKEDLGPLFLLPIRAKKDGEFLPVEFCLNGSQVSGLYEYSLDISTRKMQRGMLGWGWLLALMISGICGHWTQVWHSFFPYMVRFSALLIPALIVFLGPRGGRLILLRGALCHILPLLMGYHGLFIALVYAFLIGRPLSAFPVEFLSKAKPSDKNFICTKLVESARNIPLIICRFSWNGWLLCFLWVLVFFFIFDPKVIESLVASFSSYAYREGQLASLGLVVSEPVIFPSVTNSIIETQQASLAELLNYFYPNLVISILGILCFLVSLFFFPGFCWFIPLVILSVLSLQMGGRMAMFGPPGYMLALCIFGSIVLRYIQFRLNFSLGQTAAGVRRKIRSAIMSAPVILSVNLKSNILRPLSCLIFCVILGWPLLFYLPDYTQGPMISREHAASLKFLKENSPEESVVWNWWDWGYATHYFAGRKTIADGARHGGASLYLPAAVYASQDLRFARQLIKYTAGKGNVPAKVFEGLSATDAQRLMDELRDGERELIVAPGKQYIVVSLDLLRVGLWVTRYGSWDFNLKEGKGALMSSLSAALEFDMKDGMVRPRGGAPIYADSIDILSPSGIEHGSYANESGYHFLFNPMPSETKAAQDEKANSMLSKFWELTKGSFFFTATVNDKIAMTSGYYDSLLVRLLLCDPDEPEVSSYFSLVYDNVYTRIYEVK